MDNLFPFLWLSYVYHLQLHLPHDPGFDILPDDQTVPSLRNL